MEDIHIFARLTGGIIQTLQEQVDPTSTNAFIIVTGVATAVIAVFTFFLWRVQSLQFRVTHQALLEVPLSLAQFTKATMEVRLEVLIINKSFAPATVLKWEALVESGKYHDSITDGDLVKTRLFRVPRYVGGLGWGIERGEPTALSINKVLTKELRDGALINLTVDYTGGKASVTTLTRSTPVEIV